MQKSSKEECFQMGRDGERAYMAHCLRNGRTMVEVGALRERLGEGGAPMIYIPGKGYTPIKLISPDFLAINARAMMSGKMPPVKGFVWTAENMWNFPFIWDEVKTKNGCTFSRKLQVWQTGIDGYQFRHYRNVEEQTKIPVLLNFLQKDSVTAQNDVPKCAGPCPIGLYVCPVMQEPDATYPWNCSVKEARMVYWTINKLIYLGQISSLGSAEQPHGRTRA